MLTDIAIRNVDVPYEGSFTLWDGNLRNFGVRVTSKGVRTFIVLLGSGRRKAIGRYPIISIKQAREEAKRIFAEKTLSKMQPSRKRFGVIRDEYTDWLRARNRATSHKETSRLLNRHFEPFKNQSIGDILAVDVATLIDRLSDTPGEARHAFSAIKTMMKWASGRGYLAYSPLADMRPPSRPIPQDRVLSDNEIKLVWKHANDWPFGVMIRLLILLGSRRGEIAQLRWDWIDEKERVISFPRQVMKADRPNVVPYGDFTAGILAKVPNTGPLLFPARGNPDAPFSGFSKGKAALDKKLQHVGAFTIHSIRRTVATNLAALDVRVEVTEALLGHTSGKLGGIVAVYQKHNWVPQMREAQQLWEQRLKAILGAT